MSFNSSKHDKTNKIIFGKVGLWGDEVHQLIFTERKNQVATFICGKLYRYFIKSEIDVPFVEELATLFIASNWELLPVLKSPL